MGEMIHQLRWDIYANGMPDVLILGVVILVALNTIFWVWYGRNLN